MFVVSFLVPPEAEGGLCPEVPQEAAHRGDPAAGTRLLREEHPPLHQTQLYHKVPHILTTYCTVQLCAAVVRSCCARLLGRLYSLLLYIVRAAVFDSCSRLLFHATAPPPPPP